jgi:drug/metabolite transporter, DME family
VNKSHPLRGYFFIAGATLFWGISATLGRGAFIGHFLPQGHSLKSIDPLILSQSRATFSFLVLFPVLAARRGMTGLRLPRVDLIRVLLLGVFGVAFSNYLYYFAIQKTNVATAIILQYTAPVLVLVYMVARGLQRATLKRVAAAVLAFLGSGLVVGAAGRAGVTLNTAGVMAALLAAVCFSYYNIAGYNLLARYDHWLVLLYTTLSATVFWLAVNPPWKVLAAGYTGFEWAFLLVFAVVSVLLPFSLYFAGLRYLEPTRAIVVSCLEPVFSIIIAAIVLGESVRPAQAIGIAIVLAAIVLVQWPEIGEATAVRVLEPVD